MSTAYVVSVDGTEAVDDGEIAIDWDPDSTQPGVSWSRDFFTGWRPSRMAADLLLLAGSVYCIDKFSNRADSSDGWTRTISVAQPVAEPADWLLATFDRALEFLTGDHWTLRQVASSDPLRFLPTLPVGLLPALNVNAVSLFSGGLDSLCGVVDWLESNPSGSLGLVAHYEGGQASPRQQRLHARLQEVYGSDRVVLRRLWLRPRPGIGSHKQEVAETTTRARSLLFMSAALAFASSFGADTPVLVPENGYIALNVPLTRARVGSLSTRTTHPYFLSLLGSSAAGIGISNSLSNPFEFMTKGEMLRATKNPALLRELAPMTVSCSHPEIGRWTGRAQGNCGYCFPCIIRQAALYAAGFAAETHSWDVLDDATFLDASETRGADLRAVIGGVYRTRPDSDVIRNGPLLGSRRDYVDVWRRGNAELHSWLKAGATGALRTHLDALR